MKEYGAEAHGSDYLYAGHYACRGCCHLLQPYEIEGVAHEAPDQADVDYPDQLVPLQGGKVCPSGGEAFDDDHPEYPEELDIEEQGALFYEPGFCGKTSHETVESHSRSGKDAPEEAPDIE